MTTPGIGGGGLMGLAIEVLPPPVQAAGSTSAAGGTLADGAYRYYVTAVNANGETTISNEITITAAGGGTSVNTVNWAAVTGATSYNIYRTAAGGAAGTQLLLSADTASPFLDTGALTPSGAFPTVNTALAYGTYNAPTKFFPINNESLKYEQATIKRRPIRESVDVVGVVDGDVHVNGDIEMEALEDVIIYFLLASRTDAAKTGGGADKVYNFLPNPDAVPTVSLSLTVVRNGIVFGYTGCVLSQFTLTPVDGLLMFNVSIIGSDETVQSLPTAVWPTTIPFGAGQYEILIAGTQVFDTDTFEFMVNDNAEPQYRLKNTGRGAQFVKFGERETTTSMERDFINRTDYDAFKALTSQVLALNAEKSATNYITMTAPVAVKDTYEVGLSGQGDLVRAAIEYVHVIDSNGDSYEIEVGTQENIGLVT